MYQEATDTNQYEMTQSDVLDTKLKSTDKYKKKIKNNFRPGLS